jgi:hypothetical protein
MSAPDRSWTITPTLVWFAVALVVALFVFDGGVRALADRFKRRDPSVPVQTGPAFTAKPAVVADNGDSEDHAPKPTTTTAAKAGALEDTCLDGTPDACRKWAMDGFYHAVAAMKKGTLGRAVRASWYGDSVVATDAIPGRLRVKLQGELGDG